VSLIAGTRLGPYEILNLLGAGGMGDVYRARDTRLDRLVAIKVSKEAFTDRFQREARAISALNHPRICTLHDVGPNYLVMELLEGKSLSAILSQGALPIETVESLGIQLAEALSAAHAKGITHRDLKPANIMVTDAGVKILDFGLAKFRAQPDETVTVSRMAVGTPAYMAPEQIEGRECDARTDIFALGLVLREMTTGKRASMGYGEPDPLTALPPRLARVIERCLMRSPGARWQTAADVKRELEAASRSPSRRGWLVGGAAALLGIGGLVGWLAIRRAPAEPPRAGQLLVAPPTGTMIRFDAGSAVSPDGRLLAFVAADDAANRIWVRPVDSSTPRELAGTDGARFPFWSPDSKSLAFFASGKLKRVDVAAGLPVTLCDVIAGTGGSWSISGLIVFTALNDGPLMQISATGGEATPLTSVDRSKGENSHRWPHFLPDGRHLVFSVRTDAFEQTGVYWTSLDRPTEKKQLIRGRTSAWYVARPRGAGRLLWVSGDRLVAQDFDPASGTLSGEIAPIADGPFVGVNTNYFFSASTAGTLFYEKAPSRKRQLTWFNRDGTVSGTVGASDSYIDNSLWISHDGTQAILTRTILDAFADVWVMDLRRGVPSPATFTGLDGWAVWSPQGGRIAYVHGAPPNVFLKEINDTGAGTQLISTRNSQLVEDWSSAGMLLVQEQSNDVDARAKTGVDLVARPVSGESEAVPIAQTPATETNGRFSPDGRWVSYSSNETGSQEVWVKRFPDGTGKVRVSSAGGDHAVWKPDGSELFYRAPDGTLMSVTVRGGARSLTLGMPTSLFKIPGLLFDVARDGRILTLVPLQNSQASALTVVLNW